MLHNWSWSPKADWDISFPRIYELTEFRGAPLLYSHAGKITGRRLECWDDSKSLQTNGIAQFKWQTTEGSRSAVSKRLWNYQLYIFFLTYHHILCEVIVIRRQILARGQCCFLGGIVKVWVTPLACSVNDQRAPTCFSYDTRQSLGHELEPVLFRLPTLNSGACWEIQSFRSWQAAVAW